MMVTRLRALTGDAAMITKWSKQAFYGTVHSVFAKVVNMVDENDDLYSIAAEVLDNAPGTLRIDLSAYDSFLDMGIGPGSSVHTDGSMLFLGKTIQVDLTSITLWQSVLPAFPSGEQEMLVLKRNLKVVRHCVLLYGRSGGLKELLCHAGEDGIDLLSQKLVSGAQWLLDALRCRDFPTGREAGRKLLGLGNGLTPSGDDFCTGLITVFHMPLGLFSDEYRQWGNDLAAEARGVTTALSQTMLRQAAIGKTREIIISLLGELNTGSPADVAKAAIRVLHVGSLSGTDLVVGIIAGLELGLNLHEENGKGGILWP
jgi:hypothetical protein